MTAGWTVLLAVMYTSAKSNVMRVCAACFRQIQAVALVGAIAPPYPGIGKGMALFFRFGYW